MVTGSMFNKWLLFMSLTFCAAKSATLQFQQKTNHFNRITNEMDCLHHPEFVDNAINQVQNERNSQNFNDYIKHRNDILNYEMNTSFGNDVTLTKTEKLANQILMEAKELEYNVGFSNPYVFEPSRHIFEVLDEVKQSQLFQIIQKMPKGGILHSHDTAMCSANYLVSLTYWPHLWQRTSNGSDKIVEFRFSRDQPHTNESNTWRLVKDARAEIGTQEYDKQIRSLFTLFDKNVHPKIQFKDVNDVWVRFMSIFSIVGPIITYAPIWKAYYKHALEEMQEDGVQYLEFRGTLPKLYDLNGTDYSDDDAVSLYMDALDEFMKENPSFIGSKFIYAPLKAVSNETADSYLQNVQRLRSKFPQFVAGFDFVGQEDKAPPLVTFAERILALPDDIKFFFHAGETNWFGSTDENLIDAVLLGSHRIGHGYALAKHPKVIDLVKSNDIAVEVNPISNQVLKLVDDYRNHPASIFLAQNIPIVISSDDPSFWEVTPLSHDYYMAFLGIASRHSDLRVLKKFATNSIQYSSLNDTEKIEAFSKWQIKWDKFINDLVNNPGTINNHIIETYDQL